MSGRTHAVQLDQMRPLKFTTNAIRLLDKELGQHYGRGFMHFIARFPRGEESVEQADINMDVLVRALKHGLAPAMRGSPTEEQVCQWMDQEASMPEGELWVHVMDAYMEGRGLGWEEVEEEETEPEAEAGKSRGEMERSREMSVRS